MARQAEGRVSSASTRSSELEILSDRIRGVPVVEEQEDLPADVVA